MVEYYNMDRAFGSNFRLFGILFFVVFALALVVFVAAFIKGISQWNKNNNSPRLTVDASVVCKRTNVSRHTHSNDISRHITSTTYYVTFQVESGDRIELEMQGGQYGLLVEGDHGKLTFQGTRYLGFERT